MKHALIWTIAALLASAAPAAAQNHFPITRIPTIQVAGEGSVTAEPDRARLLMRVSEIQSSVAEAKAAVDRKAMDVQKMLIGMGIDKNRINASELSIHRVNRHLPEERQNEETYQVSRQITVTIPDISQLDTVLDRSVSLGTNELWQVDLYTSREQELRMEAMRLAARDARRKAEALAAEFDRGLGKIYMAEHAFGGGGPVYRMALREADTAGAFSQGTIRIDARVTAVFELQ